VERFCHLFRSMPAFPQFAQPFGDFLACIPDDGRVIVYCHFDADGLAAGALFGRGLQRINSSWDVRVLPSGRTENAFETPEAKARLRAERPDALIVTDLGVNALGTLEEDGIPVLYADHHIPEGAPPAGAAVLTGYGLDPVPCSAWLVWEVLAAETDVDDLRWIAAVGILSDYGDKAAWPHLAAAKKEHTAKWLKEAVALCNAARRAPAFDVDTALRHLLYDDGPRPMADDPALANYRAEVAAELAEARKQPPRFPPKEDADAPPVAIVTIHSAAQIHPLIAQQWITRLPGKAVLCANTGYLSDGRVAISGRAGSSSLHLPDMLRAAFRSAGAEPPAHFAHGHPQASGGHLSAEDYAVLRRGLGFVDA